MRFNIRLKTFFEKYNKSNKTLEDFNFYDHCSKNIFNEFQFKNQNDSGEFLSILIDTLKDELKEKFNKEISIFDYLFKIEQNTYFLKDKENKNDKRKKSGKEDQNILNITEKDLKSNESLQKLFNDQNIYESNIEELEKKTDDDEGFSFQTYEIKSKYLILSLNHFNKNNIKKKISLLKEDFFKKNK